MPGRIPDLPDERHRQLRGAVYVGDGPRVMEALAAEVPGAVLKLAGDGLLIALGQRSELGIAPAPLLRPLPVELEELSSVLEGDPMLTGGRLDLRSGEVIPESPMFDSSFDDEDEDDDREDLERWLYIDSEGSRPGYDDMVAFLDTIDDDATVERLGQRLHGRGVFRRFKDGLADMGELERFHRFVDDRSRGRARAWLASHGYRPTLRPRA